MSIERLIESIKDCSGAHSEQLPVSVSKKIIAALRAGQEMQDACYGGPDIVRILREADYLHKADEIQTCMRMWDAVMAVAKEDV